MAFSQPASRARRKRRLVGPLAEPLPGAPRLVERAGGRQSDDPLEAPVRGLLRLKPAHLLDFLQHFVVFETKKGKTTKKIARYQQFEAVNELVDRTVSLVGKPVDGAGSHRPHLAHAGLGQVAHHDLRRPEAAAAPGARQPDGADRGGPARPQDPALGRLRRLRLPERREGARRRGSEAQAPRRLARHAGDDHPVLPEHGRPRPAHARQRHQHGGRVPPLAEGRRHGELRDDHAREARERLPLRLHRHADRPDDAEHAPRLRAAEGRRAGALPQLLRHPARDPGRRHARGALHPRPGAVQGGRGGAERRLRADVRRDGAGGRGGEGLRPAPARAVEGAGPPPRSRRDRARADAHALPGAPRPERLQGPARRRRPQGVRALQGGARREARRRAACRPSGPT